LFNLPNENYSRAGAKARAKDSVNFLKPSKLPLDHHERNQSILRLVYDGINSFVNLNIRSCSDQRIRDTLLSDHNNHLKITNINRN